MKREREEERKKTKGNTHRRNFSITVERKIMQRRKPEQKKCTEKLPERKTVSLPELYNVEVKRKTDTENRVIQRQTKKKRKA